jgi:hypothetical protein
LEPKKELSLITCHVCKRSFISQLTLELHLKYDHQLAKKAAPGNRNSSRSEFTVKTMTKPIIYDAKVPMY